MWEEPGLLVAGHDHPPMIMMGHHPAEYQGWIESAGYQPAKRLLTYDIDVTGDGHQLAHEAAASDDEQLGGRGRDRATVVEPGPRAPVLDGRGQLLRVNASLCDMLGYSAPELCRMGVPALIHTEDVADEAASRTALASGLLATDRRDLPALAADWQQMLALLAILSIALGNITAIAQSNLKRMLAYSAIAHMGFMLLGLLSGVVEGNARNAADAYSAALFYALIYALMSLGAFGVLLYLSRAGFDCENLEDLRGLNRRSPWTAFLMLLVMFSLTGIPPTAGFYAKLVVISATISAGYIWLAVAAVLFSLVGAFYYLRVVKLMYFDDPVDTTPLEWRPGFGALLSVNGLLLLAWGVLPSGLMRACFEAIQAL